LEKANHRDKSKLFSLFLGSDCFNWVNTGDDEDEIFK